MSTITEALEQISKLTKENLQILSDINKAFYSNKSHISSEINGERIAIPSFLSLETKIDTLRQDFDNIINAPKTGEAMMYFDGFTQKIVLSGYNNTPEHVDLKSVNKFFIDDKGAIFKDFLTPNPYIRLEINSIPNNIKHVNIHKVILKNEQLINTIKNNNQPLTYSTLSKYLYVYDEGVDYEEYSTIKRLPLRDKTSFGSYSIRAILDVEDDMNFESHYTLVLNEPLTFFRNNGTIERELQAGDYLVTNNDKVKMVIEELNAPSKTIKVKILYGAYADLCDETSANPDLYKLKYVNDRDMEMNKYIDVPLEEDRYVCVFVAPINDTTNTVAPYGEGIFMDVDNLVYIDESGNQQLFRNFYNNFVNNIGDSLYNITKIMSDDEQVERLSPDEFTSKMNLQPIIDTNKILVTQINKHLDDSESIKTIRSLYSQKISTKLELEKVQKEIDAINLKISEISFEDANNIRSLYTDQLTELNSKQHELQQSLNDIIQRISQSANESDTPIENAKYRIRGFIPVSDDVIKIDVEYRYKNKNKFTGNAITIGDNLIYSDWNKMDSIYRLKQPKYEDNIFKYDYSKTNEDKNEISFNQIDIPISQGEQVEFRVRYIYKYGYPFVQMMSSWSGINSVEFPVEYLKNVEILDIISENNDDIKKNQFVNLLEKRGVVEHVGDSIQDQTLIYYHKPEHISSGFLTSERRIIPLGEKLQEFSSLITDLQSEVYGADTNNLVVTLTDSKQSMTLIPNIVNTFHNQDFTNNENTVSNSGIETKYSQLTITLHNTSNYNIKLHSMFVGNNTDTLKYDSTNNSGFNINDYVISGDGNGVWMQLDESLQDNSFSTLQVYNQFMYFRVNDTQQFKTPKENALYGEMSGMNLLSDEGINKTTKLPNIKLDKTSNVIFPLRDGSLTSSAGDVYATLFPYIGKLSNITIDNGQTFRILKPNETINIPLSFYYYFSPSISNQKIMRVSRAIEFDIRTSLFKDPVTYKIVVDANKVDLKAFNVKSSTDFSMSDLTNLNLSKHNTPVNKTLTKK